MNLPESARPSSTSPDTLPPATLHSTALPATAPALNLLHRGRWVTLHGVPASRTLLDVLREDMGLTGTKEGCRSGDCGACTVVLGERTPAAHPSGSEGVRLRAVNSCIRLAHSANGMALWTVQDLTTDPLLRPAAAHPSPDPEPANSAPDPGHTTATPPSAHACGSTPALHPVQAALVTHHGSQCGFCTPGFVMSLFALYHRADGQAHPNSGQTPATPPEPLTREAVLEALSGNLCRCTGYRAIMDAALAMHQQPTTVLDTSQLLQLLKQHGDTNQAARPFFIHQSASAEDSTPDAHSSYLAPTSLPELLALRAAHPQAQLVAGCTDVGLWITKQHQQPAQVLDLTRVADLRQVTSWRPHATASGHGEREAPHATSNGPMGLAIGAAVTLTEAFAALTASRPTLAAFTSRFAGLPVRNAGTLGGNVANGSPIGDSMPMLIALGAQVRLMAWQGEGLPPAVRELPLQALYTGYRQNVMTPQEVLTHILVPPPGTPAAAQPPEADGVARLHGEWLCAYKVSKRFEDDISAVCLGLRVVLANGVVQAAHIGAGGVAAMPVQATQTQAALVGQPWSQATLLKARNVLQAEFTPISDMRASAAYRTQLLGSLLQRAWLASTGTPALDLAHLGRNALACASFAPATLTTTATPNGERA